jgi:regulator of replication initiation timing
VNNFKTTLDQIKNIEKNIKESESKSKDLETETEKLRPKINEMINKTKERQNFLQIEISKLLKGKKVNIYGDINKL